MRAGSFDLTRCRHFTDGDVHQLFVGVQSLSERARGDAERQRSPDLILCDNTPNACHYLFDSQRREKVVRTDECAALFNQVMYLSRSAADAHWDVARHDASLPFGGEEA